MPPTQACPCRMLLIEAALLAPGGETPERAALEMLCAYSHSSWRLLVVMNEPEHWQPTRRSMDRHLLLQQNIHEHLTRLGAHLDGVLYLPSPLLGRRQKRSAALLAVIERTGIEPDAVWYIGADPLNVQAAARAGLRLIAIAGATEKTLNLGQTPGTGQPCRTLDEALRRVPG